MTNHFSTNDSVNVSQGTVSGDAFAGARNEVFDLMKSQALAGPDLHMAAGEGQVPIIKLPPGPRPMRDWRDGPAGGRGHGPDKDDAPDPESHIPPLRIITF